jgi:hypothetical protein
LVMDTDFLEGLIVSRSQTQCQSHPGLLFCLMNYCEGLLSGVDLFV